jgi:hypothetical protein
VCIASERSALTDSTSTRKLRIYNVNLMCTRKAYCLEGVDDRVHFGSESYGEIA